MAGDATPDSPGATVTFLLTDIEGSTRMWEEAPDDMMDALDQHDEVIDEAVHAHNGFSVKPRGEGDSRFVVFGNARDAVEAIAEIQTSLAVSQPAPLSNGKTEVVPQTTVEAKEERARA